MFVLFLKCSPALFQHWWSLLWFSHFWLAPDWQRETWPGDSRHQSYRVSERENSDPDLLGWKVLDPQRRWRFSYRYRYRFSVFLPVFVLRRAALCDYISPMSGGWLKTNGLWILFFHWIKCLCCFSCAVFLQSLFELFLFADVCWCCISFRVERRQAIIFWMLMWWSLTRGPHTYTDKKKYALIREL